MLNLAQQLRRVSAPGRPLPTARSTSFGSVCPRSGWQRVLLLGADRSALEKEAAIAASRRGRLEAALFLSREALSLRKLAQIANLADATEARTLLNQLCDCYEERGCAFEIAQVAGGYRLLTRREFVSWLRPQAAADAELRLSTPVLETLAVVAYRQPVLRAEVEAIRGVACGELLRQLMDRDLIRIVGRSEELGRPLSYGTTKRFLQVFGLSSVEELPWAQQLRRSAGIVESDVENSTQTAGFPPDLTGRVDAA